MSRQFATNVTTIYDIFCPVPFLPSPFGFRRLNIIRSGKTDPVQFEGCFKLGPSFAYTDVRFACSFLLLGIGFLEASKRQICLPKVPLRNPI